MCEPESAPISLTSLPGGVHDPRRAPDTQDRGVHPTCRQLVNQAVQENARRLQDAFAAVRGQLGQYCGQERFEKCFKMSDIELHSDQLQYIYSVMFAITKDVDLIEFSKFFSRFNIDPNYVSNK